MISDTFSFPRYCSRNSSGVRYPRAWCGRIVLYTFSHCPYLILVCDAFSFFSSTRRLCIKVRVSARLLLGGVLSCPIVCLPCLLKDHHSSNRQLKIMSIGIIIDGCVIPYITTPPSGIWPLIIPASSSVNNCQKSQSTPTTRKYIMRLLVKQRIPMPLFYYCGILNQVHCLLSLLRTEEHDLEM